MHEKVVRVSIGRFDSTNFERVHQALVASYDKLAPGIRAMSGNQGYFAGIDKQNAAIVNVSTWESLDNAKQMESFRPMLDLAGEFVALGVRFERPVLNFETVWTIEK